MAGFPPAGASAASHRPQSGQPLFASQTFLPTMYSKTFGSRAVGLWEDLRVGLAALLLRLFILGLGKPQRASWPRLLFPPPLPLKCSFYNCQVFAPPAPPACYLPVQSDPKPGFQRLPLVQWGRKGGGIQACTSGSFASGFPVPFSVRCTHLSPVCLGACWPPSEHRPPALDGEPVPCWEHLF